MPPSAVLNAGEPGFVSPLAKRVVRDVRISDQVMLNLRLCAEAKGVSIDEIVALAIGHYATEVMKLRRLARAAGGKRNRKSRSGGP